MDNASIPSKSNSSKGFWIFVIIGIILIIAGGIWLFWSNKSAQTQSVATSQTQPTSTSQNQSATTPSSTSQTTIKNDTDLQAASKELDNTDLDSIDTTLNQNDADASQF